MPDTDTARAFLLRLICAAPDPCGYEAAIPHYQAEWDAARQYLRETCPDHIVDGGGTCPNCHGDTDGD
jgi:hypothetical protein